MAFVATKRRRSMEAWLTRGEYGGSFRKKALNKKKADLERSTSLMSDMTVASVSTRANLTIHSCESACESHYGGSSEDTASFSGRLHEDSPPELEEPKMLSVPVAMSALDSASSDAVCGLAAAGAYNNSLRNMSQGSLHQSASQIVKQSQSLPAPTFFQRKFAGPPPGVHIAGAPGLLPPAALASPPLRTASGAALSAASPSAAAKLMLLQSSNLSPPPPPPPGPSRLTRDIVAQRRQVQRRKQHVQKQVQKQEAAAWKQEQIQRWQQLAAAACELAAAMKQQQVGGPPLIAGGSFQKWMGKHMVSISTEVDDCKEEEEEEKEAFPSRCDKPLKVFILHYECEVRVLDPSLPAKIRLPSVSAILDPSLSCADPTPDANRFIPSVQQEMEHASGLCRPCRWLFTEKGCTKGNNCSYCHSHHSFEEVEYKKRPCKGSRERKARQLWRLVEKIHSDPSCVHKNGIEVALVSSGGLGKESQELLKPRLEQCTSRIHQEYHEDIELD